MRVRVLLAFWENSLADKMAYIRRALIVFSVSLYEGDNIIVIGALKKHIS